MQATLATTPSGYPSRALPFLSPMPPLPRHTAHLPVTQLTQPRPRQNSLPPCHRPWFFLSDWWFSGLNLRPVLPSGLGGDSSIQRGFFKPFLNVSRWTVTYVTYTNSGPGFLPIIKATLSILEKANLVGDCRTLRGQWILEKEDLMSSNVGSFTVVVGYTGKVGVWHYLCWGVWTTFPISYYTVVIDKSDPNTFIKPNVC